MRPAPITRTRIGATTHLALVSADERAAARIRAGDVAAFEALYVAQYVPLCTFVAGLVGGGESAEELVQDLLCWVWEHRTDWCPRGTMRAYLFSAARNRAINYLKHRRVETQFAYGASPDGVAMGCTAAAPDAGAEAADFSAALSRSMAALAPRCREACQLRWRYGFTYSEIAATMGITLKGAEALITRGLKSVRASLTPFRV